MPLVPVAGLGRPSRPGEGQCLPELVPVAMKADRRSPRAMRWGPEIRDEGIAILLVEQNSSLALGMSDRAYVIDDGQFPKTVFQVPWLSGIRPFNPFFRPMTPRRPYFH